MPTVTAVRGGNLPLPPDNLRFMREDDARFVATGDDLAREVVDRGLAADGSLLDVGSGYGRLALGLLRSTDFRGRYVGFDILRKQIAWCQSAITTGYPKVQFRLLDIRNERYNPKGTIDPAVARFPAKSSAFDACAVFSVFTHLYQPVIRRYLAEIRRVLRPGGFAVTTWLLFDDERLPAVTSDAASYPMVHVLDAETRYAVDTDPLRAIAFAEGLVLQMVAEAGLEVASLERGTWAGEPGRTFQDTIVLRRPVSGETSGVRRILDAIRGVTRRA